MFVLGFIGLFIFLFLVFDVIIRPVFSYFKRMKIDNFRDSAVYSIGKYDEDLKLDAARQRAIKYVTESGACSIYQISLHSKITYQAIDSMIRDGILIKSLTKPKNRNVSLYIIIPISVFGLLLVDYFFLIQINFRNYFFVFYMLFFAYVIIRELFTNGHLETKKYLSGSYIILGIFLISAIFYGIFGGRVFLNSNAYSDLIQVSEGVFSDDINTVDISTLPIVDKDYGEKLGSLKLGEYPAIGSEYEAGEYSDIIYQGEQYLVAPLEYRGFFQWAKNRSFGTPGYILINKVTSETSLVIFDDEENGMKITPSAFYGDEITRFAYLHGMSAYHLEEVYFEIDDSGNPYYVMIYTLPTIFINGGSDVVKIALVDPVNESVEIYNPDEVPSFVESIYPEGLIIKQLNYYGSLQNGWFNSFLAQKGVLEASDGTRTVTIDGVLHYFTGLTSAGSDESTVGFVYINTRTKEAKLFYFPGATEYAAMAKTVTLLPQSGITSSFPIPINVENVPTYFMLLKGADGRILRNIFMSVQNLEIYGMSETKTESYNAYIRNLSEVSDTDLVDVTGVIQSITSYVVSGNTMYWIEIEQKYYLLDVSNFDIQEMSLFVSFEVGDQIFLKVQKEVIVEFSKVE